MATQKRPERDSVTALLSTSEHCDQTADEARLELETAGVDVTGFLTRLKQRLATDAEAERLAWQREARSRISADTERTRLARYDGWSREAMVSELSRRPAEAPYFHKLESLTDEDLQTLLGDLDELDDLE